MRELDNISTASRTVETLLTEYRANDEKRLAVLSSDPRILTVVKALEDDPLQKVADLQRRVSLSRYWLRHLFRTETGVSLGAYITHRKMNLAAFLLRSSNIRLTEIAHAVGYRHSPSFVRAFRKHFAYSPGAYRIVHQTLRAVGLTEATAATSLAKGSVLTGNADKTRDLLK
jgi:AraC-like DNA-binding protein